MKFYLVTLSHFLNNLDKDSRLGREDSNQNYNFKTSNFLLTEKDTEKSTIHKYRADLEKLFEYFCD
jgi:hypothetical protein